jgi:hypothetical protein
MEGTCRGTMEGCPPCMTQCARCARSDKSMRRSARILESQRLGIECDEDGYPTPAARADCFGMESLTEDEQLELLGYKD